MSNNKLKKIENLNKKRKKIYINVYKIKKKNYLIENKTFFKRKSKTQYLPRHFPGRNLF